jgi:hypothetical protein
MAEYGDIFDFNQTTMVFEALTLAFVAAYGLALVWITAQSKNRVLSTLQRA